VAEKRSELERKAASAADERESALQLARTCVINAEDRASRAEESARAAEAQIREAKRRHEEQASLEREQESLRQEIERQKREQQEEKERLKREADARTAEQLEKLGALTGDQRMCASCRSGPYENQACPDLQLHNDESGGNINRCRKCDWFNANWHEWPKWDGVYGPH